MRNPAAADRAITLRAYMPFAVVTCVLIIAAHWVAYLTHEFSHSFLAWALGWMADPLAIDYGKPTLSNILFLGDVSDNVNYDPILASGNGLAASSIALAGIAIGNALLYFIIYRIARICVNISSPFLISILFWLSLTCAGNVWSYVPIRALTTHADIAISARGLGVLPWVQLPFLLIPALYIVHHFFTKMCAICIGRITAHSAPKIAMVITLTSYWFFAFYGGDGTSGNYGLISQLLSIASKYFLFPISAMWLWVEYGAKADVVPTRQFRGHST